MSKASKLDIRFIIFHGLLPGNKSKAKAKFMNNNLASFQNNFENVLRMIFISIKITFSASMKLIDVFRKIKTLDILINNVSSPLE